jgi:hypothetical protein
MVKKKVSVKESFSLRLSPTQLLLLTGLTTGLYIAFSFFSDGFYQHDEAAHFINMRTFWFNPNAILGNWPKPGYKLLYVIPALAGPFAVLSLNAIFSAFTAFFCYKIAEKLSFKLPLLTFVLMATQPLWIQLAFRNYSEIPTAFLLSVSAWLFYRNEKNDWWFVGLVLSYLTLLRQEFYVIAFCYALFVLVQKKWKLIFVLPLFPILIHIWGWMATDDPLYLLTSTFGTAETYKDAYPRLGFDHYFKMMIVITGPIVLAGFFLSLPGIIKEKLKHPLMPLLVVSLVYFGLHTLFNWQAFKIGTSTGGNLRYMLVISPLLAVLATAGFESVKNESKDILSMIIIVVFAFVTLVFLSYGNNNIGFTQEKDYSALLALIVFSAVFFLMKSSKVKWGIILGIQLVFMLISVKPYSKSTEDAVMQQVVKWAESQHLFEKPTMTQHTLFYYYHGKVQQEFEGGNQNTFTEETIKEAKPGTIIFWDSHYSYRPQLRPTSVNYTWFLDRPNEFKVLKQFISPDKRFGVFIFEKL